MFHVALSQGLTENTALREVPILTLTQCGSSPVLVLSCCKTVDYSTCGKRFRRQGTQKNASLSQFLLYCHYLNLLVNSPISDLRRLFAEEFFTS